MMLLILRRLLQEYHAKGKGYICLLWVCRKLQHSTKERVVVIDEEKKLEVLVKLVMSLYFGKKQSLWIFDYQGC